MVEPTIESIVAFLSFVLCPCVFCLLSSVSSVFCLALFCPPVLFPLDPYSKFFFPFPPPLSFLSFVNLPLLIVVLISSALLPFCFLLLVCFFVCLFKFEACE